MKKHAAGFIFFAVIVAVFVGAYSVSTCFPLPDIAVIDESNENPAVVPDGHRPLRVTQAIGDPSKRTVAFSLSGGYSGVTEVDLTFYSVNGDGVSFVRDETVALDPEQWTDGKTSSMVQYKPDWLSDSRITDNLYVIATVSPKRRSYGLVPFSREHATAVLIAKN